MTRLSAMGPSLPQEGASTGVNSGETGRHNEDSQLTLRYDGSGSGDDAAWDCMLQIIRHIVEHRSLKQVAFDLDVSPSYLSHCLCERERHNVPAKWLPYLIKSAADDDLVAFMALLRNRKLAPRVELTPEQKLERVLAAIGEQLGDDFKRLLLDKAFK